MKSKNEKHWMPIIGTVSAFVFGSVGSAYLYIKLRFVDIRVEEKVSYNVGDKIDIVLYVKNTGELGCKVVNNVGESSSTGTLEKSNGQFIYSNTIPGSYTIYAVAAFGITLEKKIIELKVGSAHSWDIKIIENEAIYIVKLLVYDKFRNQIKVSCDDILVENVPDLKINTDNLETNGEITFCPEHDTDLSIEYIGKKTDDSVIDTNWYNFTTIQPTSS